MMIRLIRRAVPGNGLASAAPRGRRKLVRLSISLLVVASALVFPGTSTRAVAGGVITVEVSDAYTFSGVQRTIKTGAVEVFDESPIGPFSQGFHNPQHILSWNRGEADDVLDCDPTMKVQSVSESVTSRVVVHYTADAPGMPGEVTGVKVVIPAFQDNPPTTTSPFPIDGLDVEVRITRDGNTASAVLSPTEPPPGAQACFQATFPEPFPFDGSAQVEVSFAGEVQPALGPPQTVPLGCPPPNQDLVATQRFGVTQLILENTFVVLSIEEAAPTVLTVTPSSSVLMTGGSEDFAVFACPVDANGNPDLGPDGVPGTSDDLCTPVDADWTASSGIGIVSPATGSSTTFTAADVAPGETASGAVLARVGTDVVFATVLVEGPPATGDETHVINLEVERMFRQGLPMAKDVSAGDTQVVVRPTTAHELESLGTMVVGGTVLPFDARSSLLGALVAAERTIVAVSPADLGLVRQGILDDIEASGRDSTDPRTVERFLRRNPNRGRVTLALDAGVDRDLLTGEGAYAGSLDAGLIDFRADLLLREAQRERIVRDRGQDRRVRVLVNLVENDAVTNVLPYDDSLSSREVNRLRRSPSGGGIFQGHDDPRTAQLIAVNDGRGDEGRTNWRDYAHVNAARVGEDADRSAHALAHMVGKLLFGGLRDRGSTLFIMHDDPARVAGAGDGFYTANFDDFRYSDRTVRRGLGHLDRYWRR